MGLRKKGQLNGDGIKGEPCRNNILLCLSCSRCWLELGGWGRLAELFLCLPLGEESLSPCPHLTARARQFPATGDPVRVSQPEWRENAAKPATPPGNGNAKLAICPKPSVAPHASDQSNQSHSRFLPLRTPKGMKSWDQVRHALIA